MLEVTSFRTKVIINQTQTQECGADPLSKLLFRGGNTEVNPEVALSVTFKLTTQFKGNRVKAVWWKMLPLHPKFH